MGPCSWKQNGEGTHGLEFGRSPGFPHLSMYHIMSGINFRPYTMGDSADLGLVRRKIVAL